MLVSDNAYPKYWLRNINNGQPILYKVTGPDARPTYFWPAQLRALHGSSTPTFPQASDDFAGEGELNGYPNTEPATGERVTQWIRDNRISGVPDVSV
jgi:hypothetical protein